MESIMRAYNLVVFIALAFGNPMSDGNLVVANPRQVIDWHFVRPLYAY